MSSVTRVKPMRRLFAGVLCVTLSGPLLAQETPVNALELNATYIGEFWRQAAGGIETGNRFLDDLELTAEVDGGRVFGLEGLKLFGFLLYNNGHVLSDELSGTAQGVSNIEAVAAVRLYEMWSQWQFGAGDDSIRFGLYDLNSEFDAIETAGLFINPSHGIGPDFAQTGENGPSIFPITSLAVRGVKSFGPWSVQAAVLDGVPGDPDHPDRTSIELSRDDGALLVGEMNYRGETGFRIGGGYWQYTSDFDDLTALNEAGEPQRRGDNAGAYLIVESPALFAQDERGLNLFLRVGEAEERINPVGRYLGGGVVYSSPFLPQRDQIGFAIAVAELGDPFRQAQASAGIATDAREYNYELTYRIAVNEWFALQSDVQYIDNPGMDPQLQSGWAVGLRVELSRGWAR